MPIDKASIRKGTFMTGTECAGHFRLARDEDATLRAEFPEFEDTQKSAGPMRGPVFEREQAAIKALAAQLQAVRDQLKKVRGK